LGGTFLVDYMDDSLWAPKDLTEFKNLTLLGIVPSSKIVRKRLISTIDPQSQVFEAYRMIKNNLKHLYLSKSIKSLVITSPERGNGRTTTAANLGIAIAKQGKSVLLIDLDLRNPGIHKKFGLNGVRGITDYLVDDLPIEEIIRNTGMNNLNIIPCGNIPSDPAAIIESARIPEVIDQLLQKYDLIIMDTPPLTLANDALVLGNYSDVLMTIVERGKTTFSSLNYCMELLKNVGLKCEGVIFNKFKSVYGKCY
jgi:capsular exopolysaccharide synthesis family protein